MPKHDGVLPQEGSYEEMLSKVITEGTKWNGSHDLLWQGVQARLVRSYPLSRVLGKVFVLALSLMAISGSLLAIRSARAPSNDAEDVSFPAVTASAATRVDPGGSVEFALTYEPDGTYPPWSSGVSQMRVVVQSLTPGSPGIPDEVVKEIPLGPWSAGTSFNKLVRLVAPAEPGWYSIGTRMEAMRGDDTVHLRGPATQFFVSFPEGSVREGVVRIEKAYARSGETLTVHQVSMTPSETTVTYSLSTVVAEGTFELRFLPEGTVGSPLLHRDETVLANRVSGVAVFGPTPADADSLRFKAGRLAMTIALGPN